MENGRPCIPGRYGAKLIETDAYFLEASRYIHRNPLEAKMVIDLYDYPCSGGA
jgi:putative transposase